MFGVSKHIYGFILRGMVMEQDENGVSIDSEAFGRYAKSKGISIKVCPSCGTVNPLLLVHDNGSASTALAFTRDASILMRGLPVVTVECDSCGFLFLYNREKVEQSLKGESNG